MNELIFFAQTLLIVGFALGAFKLGKQALVAWIAIQALLANLFVLKQVTLFGLEVTASDAYVIGSLLGLNFLQEYYDQKEAIKATKICFFFMLFFTLVSQLHLIYQPSPYDSSQSAFLTILTPSPRLMIASITVFFIVQQIDVRFFAFLKKNLPQTNFAVRAGIALVFSQLLDTVLFSLAGLYGVVASVIDIMIMSFMIKLIVIFCIISCIRWARA